MFRKNSTFSLCVLMLSVAYTHCADLSPRSKFIAKIAELQQAAKQVQVDAQTIAALKAQLMQAEERASLNMNKLAQDKIDLRWALYDVPLEKTLVPFQALKAELDKALEDAKEKKEKYDFAKMCANRAKEQQKTDPWVIPIIPLGLEDEWQDVQAANEAVSAVNERLTALAQKVKLDTLKTS